MRDILILQTARLGDLAQTAPLLRGLRREHPGARLTLVIQSGLEALIEGSGLCDRLIRLPADSLAGLAESPRQEALPGIEPFASEPAFREGYDLLVNASNDAGSSALCRLIPASRKAGRIQSYDGELRLLGPWSKYLYAMVSHRRENMFNVVDILAGLAGIPLRPEPASLPVPEARRAEARAILEAAGLGSAPGWKGSGMGPSGAGRPLDAGRPLVALQAGASSLHRAWSLENFAALGAGLARDPGVDLVLIGDARERERCDELAARIGGGRVANLAGRTTLPQLHAVLGACDLLISNDTGSIHVAAAAGTPALGLYFSTAWYAETAPYGAGHAVLQVEIPCAPCDASAICPVQKCRDSLPAAPVCEAARWLLKGAPPDSVPAPAPNLSLYLSRFLDDGSLAYLPVRPESASDRFQEALLGRLLWHGTLGLRGDRELDRLRSRLRGEAAFRRKREALSAALAVLETPVLRGLEAAAELGGEFLLSAPARDRILALHGELAALGASLAAASGPAGLCGAFLHFEMMDMDYAEYPMLASILAGKYRMLAERIAGFRAVLEAMR